MINARRLPAGTVRQAVGDGWEAAAIIERVGMGALAEADITSLSGGQAKRVALARTLVADADLLVLDEPTNHLDIAAIAWLEDRLAAFRGGLVIVTHDRHVLDRVTTRIIELDRGVGYVHDGGYASYLEARADARYWRQRRSRPAGIWPGPNWPGCGEGRRRGPANPRPESPPPPPWSNDGPTAQARAGELDLKGIGTPRGLRRPAWATRSSVSTGSDTVSATARGCSRTWTSISSPAAGWASSAPTAPASRRCSTSWPGG